MREGVGRDFSAEQLLGAHLAAIEKWNPSLGAFTQIYREEAIARAREPLRGPLAGVPVSIKDSLDIAGHPTVCGARFRRDTRPGADAVCVKRLRAAGAILLGKTNTPEYLMNWDTFNDVYGPTRNPWHLEYSPGGSSGGEAAAIAACMSAGGVGSDGGGSIRLPAALCGICGLKPTPGRVPATGHFPRVGHPGGLLGVVGPMARSVEDLQLLYEVIAGHNDSDPFSAPVPALPDPPEPRAGLLGDVGYSSLLPRQTERFPAFPWDKVFETWRFFFLRLNAPFIGFPTPHTAAYFDLPPPTAEEILLNLAARDALRARLLALMDRFPFLIAPVCTAPAWRTGKFPGPESIAPLTYANLLGLPALTLPVGVNDGLPVAWQLIAKPWHESALLRFAAGIEAARGAFPSATLLGHA